MPIFFTINSIPTTQKFVCYGPGPPGPYRTTLSYFNLIAFVLVPSLLMLVFGRLALRQIHRRKRLHVVPSTTSQNSSNQNTQKTERQMLRMLIIQVLVYSATGLTFSIALIISAANASQSKNVAQIAQENLINAFVGVLSNTGPCSGFYLFTRISGISTIRNSPNEFGQCRNSDVISKFLEITSEFRQYWRISVIVQIPKEIGQ